MVIILQDLVANEDAQCPGPWCNCKYEEVSREKIYEKIYCSGKKQPVFSPRFLKGRNISDNLLSMLSMEGGFPYYFQMCEDTMSFEGS